MILKMLNLRLCAGTLAFLTALQSISPTVAFAKDRSLQISITDHGFVPNSVMTVLNQQVKIHVVNNGRKVHQFSIPYYRIYTEDLNPGQTSDIAFAPWTAGRFDMTSDPSGTDNPEFKGNFNVTDHK